MDDNSAADQAINTAKAQTHSLIVDTERQLGYLEHQLNVSQTTGQPISEAVNEFVMNQRAKLSQIAVDLNSGAIDAQDASAQTRVISNATENLTRATHYMGSSLSDAEQRGMHDEAANIRNQLAYAAQQSSDDVNIQLANASSGGSQSTSVGEADNSGTVTADTKMNSSTGNRLAPTASSSGLSQTGGQTNATERQKEIYAPFNESHVETDRFGNRIGTSRLPTAVSVADAEIRLANPKLDPNISGIIDKHVPVGATNADKVNAIRTNPELRTELGGYFENEIAKRVTEMPPRVAENGSKGVLGGYAADLTSREYASNIAISKLDGTFQRDRSDPIQVSDNGIIGGEHRTAADKLLGFQDSPVQNVDTNETQDNYIKHDFTDPNAELGAVQQVKEDLGALRRDRESIARYQANIKEDPSTAYSRDIPGEEAEIGRREKLYKERLEKLMTSSSKEVSAASESVYKDNFPDDHAALLQQREAASHKYDHLFSDETPAGEADKSAKSATLAAEDIGTKPLTGTTGAAAAADAGEPTVRYRDPQGNVSKGWKIAGRDMSSEGIVFKLSRVNPDNTITTVNASSSQIGNEISPDQQLQKLRDVYDVGPGKPIGYIDNHTVETELDTNANTITKDLESKGLKVITTDSGVTMRNKGAIIAYDEKALGDVLQKNSEALTKAGWPTDPKEFVLKVTDIQAPQELAGVIKDAYGIGDLANNPRVSGPLNESSVFTSGAATDIQAAASQSSATTAPELKPRTVIPNGSLPDAPPSDPKIVISQADHVGLPSAGSVITPGAGSAVEPGSDLNDATVKKVQVIRSDGTVDGGWLETGRTGDVVTVTKVQNGEVLTKNVRLSDFELAQQYPAGAVIDRAAISSSNVQPVGRNDFGPQYEPNGERNARPTMIDRETGMTWSVPRDGVSTTSVSASPSSTPSSPADPLKDKPADAPAASSAAVAEPADPPVAEPVTAAAAADSGADPKVGWKSYEYNAPPGNQTADEWSQWKKEADAKPKVEINTAAAVSDEAHPFGETGWQWTDKPKPIQQLKNADAAVENIGTELSTKVNNYVAKKYGNTKAFKVAQKVGYFRDPGSGSATDTGESSASASEKPKADHSTGASTKDGRVKITVSGEEPTTSAAKLTIDKATTPAPDKPAASEPKADHTSPGGGSAATDATEPGGSHTAHDKGTGNKLKEGKRTVINDGSPGVDQPNHVNLRTKEHIGQPKPKHTSLIDDNSPGVDQPNHVNLTNNDKPKVHKVSLAADVGGGGEDVKAAGTAAEAAGSGSKILKGVGAVSKTLGVVGDAVMVGGLVYQGGKDTYKDGKKLAKDIKGGHPINVIKDEAKLASVPGQVASDFVKQNVSMAHQAVTTETAGVSKKVSLAGQMVTVGDNHTPQDTLQALEKGMGPGWKMVNKHTNGYDDYVFERQLYNSKGQPSGSQVVTDGTFEMTTKGAGSPYKDPATQKRIAADEKLNHKLFTPTTPGGTAPINNPSTYLKPTSHTQPVKPDVKGLSGSQTLPEEMSTAQLAGWGWHLAKKGTSTTPAVWTKNGNTLDIYENGSATYTNTANGHAITQSVRVSDAGNAGFTGGSGSAAGAVPAGAVADPNHAGRFLLTTKKAGGSYNGATETNVYDKNGHLLGQNVTYYSNGKRYDYGYDFGSKPPAGVGYSSSGEVVIPGVNDKITQTSTVAVPVSRDPGAQQINLAGGGWMASKGNDSLHAPYWYRQVGTKNGKAIYETFYPDPKTGEGVIMYDGKRSGYGQTGNLDMIGGSSTRTVTTTTNVKVASGLHFTDVNHPGSTRAASAIHTPAPAPVPVSVQSPPSYVPEPTRPKALSLQISTAKPSGWESHSTGDLASRLTGQAITINGKNYKDVTVSHFTDGTSTYQVKGKIIGYGEPSGTGGFRTDNKTLNDTPAPKTNPKTHNHSAASNPGASGPNNSGYNGNTPAKNPATTMISDHPTLNNTPAQVNLVSENGGGMGTALKNGAGEGAHPYTGGAAIESVKHLKNGATLTTTASGAEIETTAAGNSYVVKAPPASASEAATAYRHGVDGGLPGAAGEVHMAPTTPQAVTAEAARSYRVTEPQQPAATPAPTPEPVRSMPHGAILAESEAEGSVNPNLTPSNGGAIAAGRPAVTQPAPTPEPVRSMPHGAILAESEAEGSVNPNLTPSNGGAIAAGVPAAAPAPVPTVTQSQIEAAANYSSIANTKSNDMMAPVTSGPAFTLPVSSHPTDVTATNALSNFNVTSNVRRFGRQIE